MRVLGLPLHLWSKEVLQKIEDGCGGLVNLDDDTALLSRCGPTFFTCVPTRSARLAFYL